jgi:hypothetical protein
MDTPRERSHFEEVQRVQSTVFRSREFKLSAEDVQTVREAEKVSQQYAIKKLLELLYPAEN